MGTIVNIKLTNKAILLLMILLMISSFLSCTKVEEEVNESQYIVLINDQKVSVNEIMIYVYQVVEEFQEIGGVEVWEFEDFSGGKSAVEVAKDAVIENIVRIKVLNSKSVELGIQLSEEEKAQVNIQAREYIAKMSSEYKQIHEVNLDLMLLVFKEFALANKVIDTVTSDYAPSELIIEEKMTDNIEYKRISELQTIDLLTEINVEQLVLQTRRKDQSGEYVTLTDYEKSLKYNKAVEIVNKAENGEAFEVLIKNYSEETVEEDSETNGLYNFSKALLPDQFRDGLVDLEIGEISQIIESETGYHIFKVVEIKTPTNEDILNFDKNFVLYKEDLKKSVVEELKKEAFDQLYSKWKESVKVSIDRVKWDLISLQI